MKKLCEALLVLAVTILASVTYGQLPFGWDDMPRTSSRPPTNIISEAPLPDASSWASTPFDWSSSLRQFLQAITNNETGRLQMKFTK
jgi:hypothetical protein